jgi:hypothetical protein
MGLACSAEPSPAANPIPAPPPVQVMTTEPRVAPAPEPPALDAFPAPEGEPRYKRVLSKRLRLSIPLPNRSGWKMKREKSSFLILDHASTASRLLVSIWRENELMNRDTCEERARWLRELPKRSGETLSSRGVKVPPGFDTEVDVGFASEGEGAPIDGWVLAFGGRARECFAFIYTTTSSGDGAEQVVGDRLAVMQTLTLEGIERRTGIGIGREPMNR